MMPKTIREFMSFITQNIREIQFCVRNRDYPQKRTEKTTLIDLKGPLYYISKKLRKYANY